MANQVNWFDIPVTNLDRAITFYSRVLNTQITKDTSATPVGVLAHNNGEVSGCLHESHDNKPSGCGPLLYFNVNGRLDDAVMTAVLSGGKIIKAKHPIGQWGYRAIIQDTEGNRIALHSL